MSHTCPGWSYLSNHLSDDSGRIIIIWKFPANVFCLHQSSQSLTCEVQILGGHKFFFTAIYASNLSDERADLWCILINLHNQLSLSDHQWVVGGDFNQIIHPSEHSSPHVNSISSRMVDMRDCLLQLEVSDLRFQGVFNTWSNKCPSNPTAKKLDRLLVNSNWLSSYPNSIATFSAPLISDHSPCLLDLSAPLPTYGTKPFKYLNYLSNHPQFHQRIESTWNHAGISLPLVVSLTSLCVKLKFLKKELKILNADAFSGIEKRVREINDLLQNVQVQALSNPTPALFQEERDLHAKWSFLRKIEEEFFKQKSRINWLKAGDSNTSYFHRYARSRNSGNAIRSLTLPSGAIISDPKELSELAVNHFRSFLCPSSPQAPLPSSAWIQELTAFSCPASIRTLLCEIPSQDEITKALFQLNPNKSPGPDGFTSGFFKSAWSIVGKDVLDAVSHFFISGFMPTATNSTILCLVPKRPGASAITDYRPIACCNTLYKLISKLLVSRLKPVLPLFIQKNQTTFVRGRLLVENILLATEIVNGYHKAASTPMITIKVDIAKAFDTIRWDFIFQILRGVGFPELYLRWLHACICSPSFSVGFNGTLQGYFKSNRGLRQGDPLSPYLFVLAMNFLSLKLDFAASQGKFNYHPKCEQTQLTHLCFADDLLIFTDGSLQSVTNVLLVLSEFEALSGLAISIPKTSFYTAGLSAQEIATISTSTGLTHQSLPIRYLGLPLSPRKLSLAACAPLLNQIKGKLSSWASKSLSYAGRLQLLNSVISGITNFWCAAFILPKKCVEKINSLCGAFLWHGSTDGTHSAKVSWAKVTSPKEEGGLGIRNLLIWNRAACLKLIWMLFFRAGSIWVAWFTSDILAGSLSNFWTKKPNQSFSWLANKLLSIRDQAYGWIKLKVGNGLSCRFWTDNWSPYGKLTTFLSLDSSRRLGIPQGTSLAQLRNPTGWTLPNARSENQCLLLAYLTTLTLSDEEDTYSWWIDDHLRDDCSTAAIYSAIREHSPTVFWSLIVWFPGRVPKHSFMTWLIIHNRCPTRDRLLSWGLQTDPRCLLCGVAAESRDHIFYHCPFSWEIWERVSARCNHLPVQDWNHELLSLSATTVSRRERKLTLIAWQAMLYLIWTERNNRLHRLLCRSPSHIISQIDLLVRNKLASIRPQNPRSASDLLQLWHSRP